MSKRTKEAKKPHWQRKVEYLARLGAFPRGAVTQVDIAHDSWCNIYQGKPCNCDPAVHIGWVQHAGIQN